MTAAINSTFERIDGIQQRLLSGILSILVLLNSGCSTETNSVALDPNQTQSQNLTIPFELELVLSNSDQGHPTQTSFSYPQKIYAFVIFPFHVSTQHRLEAHWIRPDGIIQENSFFHHDFSKPNSHRVYFWLQFHEPTLIHQMGTDTTAFNGTWSVIVKCDGQQVAHSTFSLSGAPL